MQGIHIRNGMGYDIWKMEPESWHEGGGSSGMESGKGMAGGEHGHIWPQCGEFPTNFWGETMVHCRGLRAPKRRASHESSGAGAMTGG